MSFIQAVSINTDAYKYGVVETVSVLVFDNNFSFPEWIPKDTPIGFDVKRLHSEIIRMKFK